MRHVDLIGSGKARMNLDSLIKVDILYRLVRLVSEQTNAIAFVCFA